MLNKLTQKRLKEVLHYNPDTGIFTWKIESIKIKIGDIAGCKRHGYVGIMIDYKPYRANRLAWLYMKGYFPEYEVDHKDRIRDNNKWNNLRHISHSCNMKNCKIFSTNTSGVTGVSKIKNKWRANIWNQNKTIYLGRFENFIDAVKARWEAEVKYGWPNCNSTSSAYLYLNEKEK